MTFLHITHNLFYVELSNKSPLPKSLSLFVNWKSKYISTIHSQRRPYSPS